MLSFARVLVILAGIFGLPAVGCSAACSGLGYAAGAHQDPQAREGQAIMNFILYIAIAASIGSILVGAKAPRWGRTASGILSLVFAAIFCVPLIQLNFLGLGSALMLLVGAIMFFVAPVEQYRPAAR